MQTTSTPARTSRWIIFVIILAVNAVIISTSLSLSAWQRLGERLQVFSTIFLGIFIEAVPFLLLGTLSSGLADVFLDSDWLRRIAPTRAFPAAASGALMGLLFPVCECGVVPLTRRLFRKGLPIPTGIAFLLAAPVLNPIVILSTAAAFGWGKVLILRVALSLGVAVFVGLVFSTEPNSWVILRPMQPVLASPIASHQPEDQPRLLDRLRQALLIANDEFFEMGRYLVLGAALAAAMQALVPQSILLAVGHGPVTSVLVMLSLAAILSICSTVDSFVALGFAGSFSPGAILAFLVFGPMVDIKSTLMYLRVFRPRPVIYLILLPLLMSLLAGILINYAYSL